MPANDPNISTVSPACIQSLRNKTLPVKYIFFSFVFLSHAGVFPAEDGRNVLNLVPNHLFWSFRPQFKDILCWDLHVLFILSLSSSQTSSRIQCQNFVWYFYDLGHKKQCAIEWRPENTRNRDKKPMNSIQPAVAEVDESRFAFESPTV